MVKSTKEEGRELLNCTCDVLELFMWSTRNITSIFFFPTMLTYTHNRPKHNKNKNKTTEHQNRKKKKVKESTNAKRTHTHIIV